MKPQHTDQLKAECSHIETSTGKFPVALHSDVHFTKAVLNLFPRVNLSVTLKSTLNNIIKDINQSGVVKHCSNFSIVQFTLNSLSHKGNLLSH